MENVEDEMRKYNSVERYGKQGTKHMFKETDHITIWEKLDGSNASFGYIGGELRCFSRNGELDSSNNLRGFYQWVHESVIVDRLIPENIYYGEWLVKHSIVYPDDVYHKFYLFDMYDSLDEEYVHHIMIDTHLYDNGIEFMGLAPVFYKGLFKSIEHIQSFIGRSLLGGDEGEGVVVKNYEFRGRDGRQAFAKFVSDKFTEKTKGKKHTIKKDRNELDDFVDTYLTPARVEKMLHKLVDEGILHEEFAVEDMKTILQNSGGRIVDDIMDEEQDELLKLVKRKVGKKYPVVVKQVLKEMDRI